MESQSWATNNGLGATVTRNAWRSATSHTRASAVATECAGTTSTMRMSGARNAARRLTRMVASIIPVMSTGATRYCATTQHAPYRRRLLVHARSCEYTGRHTAVNDEHADTIELRTFDCWYERTALRLPKRAGRPELSERYASVLPPRAPTTEKSSGAGTSGPRHYGKGKNDNVCHGDRSARRNAGTRRHPGHE